MVNELIFGIAARIREKYPQGKYSVEAETVEQGFKEPCFFILLINQSRVQKFGNRYKADYSFAVHYYPKSKKTAYKECQEVSENLYNLLEYITVGEDLIRGINMSSRIQDGVLIFMVDFSVFALKEAEILPFMEEVTVNV